MSNVNSFASVQLAVTPLPTTATIALFPSRSADTTRANSMLALDPDLVQGGRWDGRPFRVTLSGSATASASENFTFAVYLNNASTPNTNLTTFTNDQKIIDTTTIATGAAGTVAFSLSTFCIWNSTSATNGRFSWYPEPGGIVSISGTTRVAVATAVVGAATSLTSTLAAMQFYVTTLTGTADTTSACSLDFHIDQV